ncbi:eukaryotic translation initiation factor 4E-like isoform X2 [Artemia franciscana]|nr:hypothetical protein QYM36_000066 [Artemia franciscana]
MATLDPVQAHDDSNHDPELLMSHPLQNKWTFWYYKPDKSLPWEQNLHKVTDFDTVEGFWALHNHIKPPSELQMGLDFNLFKEGIKPMWEDPSNIKGGKWVLNLDKRRRGPENDKLWLELVLSMIGELYDDDNDDICGAVFQVRPKCERIAIWLGNTGNKEAVLRIGHKIKEFLELPPKMIIVYEDHKDAANKTGSMAKNMFSI